MHIDLRIEQAPAYARHHRRASAAAARQGLAHTALVHAQAHLLAAHYLHEPGIDLVDKTRILSNQRALRFHSRLVCIVHQLHCMWVAHRYRAYAHAIGGMQRQGPKLPIAQCLRL